MERIRIPNAATYSPISLLDILVAGPVVAGLLFRTPRAVKLVQAAALATYAGSAVRDWQERRGVRKIDFVEEFGAGVRRLAPMPRDLREREVQLLVERLNDEYQPMSVPRRELARWVDGHLTGYIAGITDQWVETSTEVRSFLLARLIFPSALGACDFLSGDIAIFRHTGVFEPHVIAHEFAHRKGYFKELEAQALSYLALTASGEPVLVQAALCERLHRDLRVLAPRRRGGFRRQVRGAGLRRELESAFLTLAPEPDPLTRRIDAAIRAAYDARMRLTGQNGISDYDLGFTNFLYTVETGGDGHRKPPPAGRVHQPPT